MNTFWANVRFSHLKDTLSEVVKRFFLPFLMSVVVLVVFLVILWQDFDTNSRVGEILMRLGVAGIEVFFFGVALNLFLEQKSFPYARWWQFVPLVFGGLFFAFYHNFDSFESIVLLLLTFFGFACGLFFSAFLLDRKSGTYCETQYYNFVYKISVAILFAFVFGGLLMLAGVLAIMAVDVLFSLEYSQIDKVYGSWVLMCVCLASPILGLYHLPKKGELERDSFYENKFYSFLILYVAIPFVILYFMILFAYNFKVLLNFGNWPKGEVVWLVIGFSLVGFKTYLFSYRYQAENHFVALFRSVFPYVVLIQLLMLFYAIYLRIAQYDVTINRYFVVVFGLVLFLLCVYYIVSRQKRLIVIPATFAIAILLISLGPWGVYSLPEARQYDRFVSELTRVGIMQDGNLVPPQDCGIVSKEDALELSDLIRYLCQSDNCNRLKDLFALEIQAEEEKRKTQTHDSRSEYVPMNQYEIASLIIEYLKVNVGNLQTLKEPFLTFYNKSGGEYYPLSISGYDRLVRVVSSQDKKESESLYLLIDVLGESLSVVESGSIIESHSLKEFNQQLFKTYGNKSDFANEVASIEYSFSGTKYDGMLLMNSRTFPNPSLSEHGSEPYYSIGGQALLKIK